MEDSVPLHALSRIPELDILNRHLAEKRPTFAHDHRHQVDSDCVE
jgi:hypothetical protein